MMQNKKSIDFVGMLVVLVILVAAAGAGLFAANALNNPVYEAWLPPVAGGGIFLLILITGVALQRRFRP
jgi:hypothetical protein